MVPTPNEDKGTPLPGVLGTPVEPGSVELICFKDAAVVAANRANCVAWYAIASGPVVCEFLIIPTPACAASINTLADATALLSPNKALNAFWILSTPCVTRSCLYSSSDWLIALIFLLLASSI